MRKVLVLDDDAQIVEALGIVLQSAGYQAVLLSETEKLYQTIEKENPDIIILDIRLPGTDGRDIAHTLKTDAKYAHISIILISARVGSISGEELRGADLYLAKPFRLTALLDSISHLLDKPSSP